MSDVTHEGSEQLFDTPQTEVAPKTATDTEGNADKEKETSQPSPEAEQAPEGLKLDDLDKAPDNKAEDKKLEMIRKWQNDIDEGRKTVKDLPPAQSWLKQYLKESKKETEKLPTEIAKEIAQQVIREERERADFKRLHETLNELATQEQKSIIEEKFKLLREKGLSRIDALETATEIAKVDLSAASERRRRMAIPQPSTKFDLNSADIESMPFEEAVKIFPKEKIDEHLRSLVR